MAARSAQLLDQLQKALTSEVAARGRDIVTRQSLLQRMKNLEDEASWQDFFNTYWRLIYGLAVKLGLSAQEAEDVVQETVFTVMKRIKDFEVNPGRGSFKAWLLTITRSRIEDQRRKRGPAQWLRAGTPEDSSRTPTVQRIPDPASVDIEQAWTEHWKHNLLLAAIEKIKRLVKPRQYQMFDLHAIKGLRANKVARSLGVTEGQVFYAKYKICELLRDEISRLERQGF